MSKANYHDPDYLQYLASPEAQRIAGLKGHIQATAENNWRIANSQLFKQTKAWAELRDKTYVRWGRICLKCGSTKNVVIDHIKPRMLYPHLAYDENNLQPLCRVCNFAKHDGDETDYRPTPPAGA